MSAELCLPSPYDSERDRVGAAAFVLKLREQGVFDLGVLRAMELVGREVFAPRRYADLARSDVGLPLACGQTMTAPGTVAAMLVALEVSPGHRVLEIGTGSGYVAALLARMGAAVTSIERQPVLADSAASRLAAAGLPDPVTILCGDGLCGTGDEEARFDRILLNGSVESLAPSLLAHLPAGGRLVCGLAQGRTTRLLSVTREEDDQLSYSSGARLRVSQLFAGPVKSEMVSGNGSLT